jgi:hypothetical protein
VKAISNYTGADDKDLTFCLGDIIEVSKTPNDGWWTGRLIKDRKRQPDWRFFPANLVVRFTDREFSPGSVDTFVRPVGYRV